MLYQQGDVLLKGINNIPQNTKKVNKTNRGFVLAEGEVTGHAHVVNDDINLTEIDGTLYIEAPTDFEIKHEEHKSFTVPAGNYQVDIVNEYDHLDETKKNVED